MHIKHKLLAVSLLAVFVLPVVASAQTVTTTGQTMTYASLQAEVQSLLAEIQSLQQQLVVARGGSSTMAMWCYVWNSNLEVGSTGSDVTALQTALSKDGESVNVNGTFDDQTASAVTGFQQKYASDILTPNGLQNGTGYAGRATRAKLNAVYGCGSGNSSPIPVEFSPISTSTVGTSPISVCSTVGCLASVSLSPATYSFSIVQGQMDALLYPRGTSVFAISPNQSITWDVSMPVWGGVSFNGYTATKGTSIVIQLNSNAATLAPGTYVGAFTFSPAPGSDATFAPQTVTVNLTVAPSSTTSPSSLTLLSPNGGQVWHPGETHQIMWNETGLQSVEIYIYDTNLGNNSGNTNSVLPLNDYVPATQGYYNWTLPALSAILNGDQGSNFRIQLVGFPTTPPNPDSPDILYATSSAPFTISPGTSTSTPKIGVCSQVVCTTSGT